MNNTITILTIVEAPVAEVWECWNKPEHITGRQAILDNFKKYVEVN